MANIQLCTFHVGPLFLGVEVIKVQEVLRYLRLTRVPLASSVVRGLINLRGQIVTAIDLRRRLGLPDRAGDAHPTNVVVRTDEGAVSLLVDDVHDVVDVSEDVFERPPETLRGPARELVLGAYKLPTGLLLHLHVDRVVNLSQ